jgi:uncharacterized protein YndB with AHSA1/START domain
MNPAEPIGRSEQLPHVVRTVVEIAAPPERVFEALTDPRELGTWWSDDDTQRTDCASDPRPGGSWHVRTFGPDGTEQVFAGEYLVGEPPSRLVQTWRATDDAESSIVRYDLEPVEVGGSDGTRLTVTHNDAVVLGPMMALARHAETRARVFVRRQLHPAWFRNPQRVAWAGRVLR